MGDWPIRYRVTHRRFDAVRDTLDLSSDRDARETFADVRLADGEWVALERSFASSPWVTLAVRRAVGAFDAPGTGA